MNICEKIGNEKEKETCFGTAAKVIKEISICDEIKSQNERDWCYFKLIVFEKVNLRDPTICEKISRYKDDCYTNVAKTLGDVNICNNLDGRDRGYCQADLAEVLKDKSICEKIELQEPKEKCYISSAGILKDETLCFKLKERNKSQCYLAVAKGKKDPILCEQIYSPGDCWMPNYRHDCYSALSLDLKDPNLCEKIECKHVRDRCFNLLATSQLDIGLCEKIETESEKTECKSYINMRIKLEEKKWKLGDWELYRDILEAIEA